MRFAFSLLALRPGRVGGTEQYMRELLAALPDCLDGDEVVVVAGREAADAVETPGLQRIVVEPSPRSLLLRRAAEAFTPWRDRRLERALSALDVDAVFFPQFSMFPKALAAPAVVMVGDVQHLAMPQNFALADRLFRAAIYPYSLRRARLVLAMSDHTRRTLIELAGVEEGKIRVVRLGVPSPRRRKTPVAALPPTLLEAPYLYFPAVTHPHKGHDVLLDAFAVLVGQGLPHRLVLTGDRTPHWKTIERRVAELGLGERVEHLGYVDAALVEALYADAAAVVFPSRFEGFGLPLVEAAAHGVKVIASDLPVFRENGTEGVLHIDFTRPQELRAALESAQRARVADGAWTWRDAAHATLEALRDAAKANPNTPG